MSETDSEEKYRCPECGGKMEFRGYRPLFPTCCECGKNFHIDECEKG